MNGWLVCGKRDIARNDEERDGIVTEYLTVARTARSKVQIGACRFFGSVAEVSDEAEAEAFLSLVRAEHPEIKSHCWAYRIGLDKKQIARFSDAGEPFQSAGPPILRAIDHLQLTNTMVVVTRYFGEKHGVGGLIRAFHATAATVLEEAGVRQELIYVPIHAVCRYEQLGFILHEFEKVGARKLSQDYQEQVRLTAEVRPQEFEGLVHRVSEWTRGTVIITKAEEEHGD